MKPLRTARRIPLRSSPALLVLLLLGCTAAAPPAPAPIPEASVRPGLNERFLAADGMSIEQAVATFEVESREIVAERHAILAALGLAPGMAVADVGAGTGLFLAPFSAAVGPHGQVYAVDIAPRFVDHMRERARLEGLENVTAVLCTERSVELPGASLDLAFVCDTYHHFEYPRNTLASLRHAIRPGGQLVIVDFERIPGVSRAWILDHVRADKETFRTEIEAAGFVFVEQVDLPGLVENYMLRFRRP